MSGTKSALKRCGSLLFILTVLPLTSNEADALDRRVRIVNQTGYTIDRFYASNVGTEDWEEDILGYDVLSSGRSVTINFDDDSGYCMFDFKAVFSDGSVLVRRRVNVCEISTYTYQP